MDSSIFHSKTNCLTLKSVNDMENLGANMAKIIGENCILTLSGDLGSGKTTFVRGLARGLGIQQAITSPTYNIYNIYSGDIQLLHMDAYRLNGTADMEELMLEEFLQPPWIIALEWPEKISEWLNGQPQWNLKFQVLGENIRSVTLLNPATNGAAG